METIKNYDLSEFQTVAEALNNWRVKELIPRGHNLRQYKTLDQLSLYLTKRKTDKANKAAAELKNRIKNIDSAGVLFSAEISIEWKKSRMWGMNPTATAQIISQDANGNFIYENFSDSASGCGYDKESTVIAGCLNQSNAILKAFRIFIDQAKENPREFFGYGIGFYNQIYTVSGGVGAECYKRNFESIGYNFQRIASGKTFDVYKITKN